MKILTERDGKAAFISGSVGCRSRINTACDERLFAKMHVSSISPNKERSSQMFYTALKLSLFIKSEEAAKKKSGENLGSPLIISHTRPSVSEEPSHPVLLPLGMPEPDNRSFNLLSNHYLEELTEFEGDIDRNQPFIGIP